MWHAFSVLFRVGASLGLRHGRNPRLVCGTLSAYCLVGSKLYFYGVFVSGNIMSKALLSMGDRLQLGHAYQRVTACNKQASSCVNHYQSINYNYQYPSCLAAAGVRAAVASSSRLG
jgi:hypothetical protein